jgi:glycosyltransferase involved in cell wall biosynthesis
LGHNDATQFIDVINQYTQLFDKKEYEVTVAYLTSAPSEQTKNRTLAEHVLFLHVPKKHIRYLKIQAIKQLLQLCREKKFEIVICHRYKPIYIMLWVAQFHRIPALFFIMHELKTMQAISRKIVVACLARKNMVFAGVSNAVRDDLRQSLWRIPPERIITLYNMLDTQESEAALFSREEARRMLNLSSEAFVFGHLGRLAINKDQTTLIQAFAVLKKHYPQAKLVIAGEGILEKKLKAQCETMGIQQDVLFTGFLPQASRYMKAFDCFVLPSIQEAFGRVLLEAMIAKLPIIATHVHGIPEVIGSAGILVPARDAAQLMQAMQNILDMSEEERKALGEQAYQHVHHDFSIPVFQKQFWDSPLTQGMGVI